MQGNNYFCAKYLGNKINKRQHKRNVNMEPCLKGKQPRESEPPVGSAAVRPPRALHGPGTPPRKVFCPDLPQEASGADGRGWVGGAKDQDSLLMDKGKCRPHAGEGHGEEAVFGPCVDAHSLSDLEQVISLLCAPWTHF